MRLAFDTSFLVAGILEAHPHYPRTRPWTQAVTSGEVEARISWHAAAETWSVLTRLPAELRLEPATATLVLERPRCAAAPRRDCARGRSSMLSTWWWPRAKEPSRS